MKQFARYVILAPLATVIAGPALAQTVPPGQSCGGLLCDMGVFGHKVQPGPNGEPPSPAQMAAAEAADPHRLPCHDFLCRAFGGKEEVAAAPPSVVEPLPAVEPEKPSKHKRKHLAKAETRTPAPADAAAK